MCSLDRRTWVFLQEVSEGVVAREKIMLTPSWASRYLSSTHCALFWPPIHSRACCRVIEMISIWVQCRTNAHETRTQTLMTSSICRLVHKKIGNHPSWWRMKWKHGNTCRITSMKECIAKQQNISTHLDRCSLSLVPLILLCCIFKCVCVCAYQALVLNVIYSQQVNPDISNNNIFTDRATREVFWIQLTFRNPSLSCAHGRVGESSADCRCHLSNELWS